MFIQRKFSELCALRHAERDACVEKNTEGGRERESVRKIERERSLLTIK
jgi:hypothetical protein